VGARGTSKAEEELRADQFGSPPQVPYFTGSPQSAMCVDEQVPASPHRLSVSDAPGLHNMASPAPQVTLHWDVMGSFMGLAQQTSLLEQSAALAHFNAVEPVGHVGAHVYIEPPPP